MYFEDGVYQLENKKRAHPDKVRRVSSGKGGGEVEESRGVKRSQGGCPQGGVKVEVAAQGGVKVEESQVGSSQGGGAQEEFSKFVTEQCPVNGVRELLKSVGAAC